MAVLSALAYVYWLLASLRPASFNLPLSRVDAIYFTIGTFTTTGTDLWPCSCRAPLQPASDCRTAVLSSAPGLETRRAPWSDQSRVSAAVASALSAGGTVRLVRVSDGTEMLKPRLPFCTNTIPAAVQNASSPRPRRCSLLDSSSLGVAMLGASG